jgi:hypothetical protein
MGRGYGVPDASFDKRGEKEVIFYQAFLETFPREV